MLGSRSVARCCSSPRAGRRSRQHCDAMSPVHLAVFALGRAGRHWRWRGSNPSRGHCWSAASARSPRAALAIFASAPQCAGGGFAGMDPLVESFWYRGIAEGQPMWRQTPGVALQALVLPLLGPVGRLRACGAVPAMKGARRWLDYALLLGAALAVALFVTRAGAVAAGVLPRCRSAGSLRAGWHSCARPALAVKAASRSGAWRSCWPWCSRWPRRGRLSPASGRHRPQRASDCEVGECRRRCWPRCRAGNSRADGHRPAIAARSSALGDRQRTPPRRGRACDLRSSVPRNAREGARGAGGARHGLRGAMP